MTPGEQIFTVEWRNLGLNHPDQHWKMLDEKQRKHWEETAERRQPPPMEDEYFGRSTPRQKSRLRPRHTLPGDMRTEWLHGWWTGIAVGAVIGLAAGCLLWVR